MESAFNAENWALVGAAVLKMAEHFWPVAVCMVPVVCWLIHSERRALESAGTGE